MAVMRRFIERVISDWYRARERKPLFLFGAPQVGKTFSIETFAAAYFAQGIQRIDCSNTEEAEVLFGANINLGGVLGVLRQRLGAQLAPGRTLLFFDNIDAYPAGLERIRELSEIEPGLHVAVAGIMHPEFERLLIPLNECFQTAQLLPLSFAEYLCAGGEAAAAQAVLSAPQPLASSLHTLLLQELANYLVVGGWPASVKAFHQTHVFDDSLKLQKEIVATLNSLDFGKEAPRRAVEVLLRTSAWHPGEQSGLGDYTKEIPQTMVKRTFEHLSRVQAAYRIMPIVSGPQQHAMRRVKGFKTLLCDVGILRTLTGTNCPNVNAPETPDFVAMSGTFDQFVGQELLHNQEEMPQYWASTALGSRSKVNYLAQIDQKLCPIIIEQPHMDQALHALEVYLGAYPSCPRGFRFSIRPYVPPSGKSRVMECPVYYAFSVSAGETTEDFRNIL